LKSTTRSVAVTACLLLALTLSGVAAGANQNATPKKWVSVFCGSILTWQKTLATTNTGLNKTFAQLKRTGKADAPTVKRKLVSGLTVMVNATGTMITKVKRVGPPAVPNGAKLQSSVVSGLGLVRKAFTEALTAAKKLPTANVTQFRKQGLTLAKTLQASASRIKAAFVPVQQYSTKELNDAAKNDAACKKLAG
jgi:predicted metalloprotease with PDZ domain